MALSLHALEGRHRIALVGAANRMNPDAQNALLKTLEEPGPGTCIMLCADELGPLLPTVLSRVAHLRLAPLPVERLTDLLVSRGAAPPAPARALAIAAGGRPGIALRMAAQPEAVLARARIARSLLDLVRADRRTRLAASAELQADGALLDAAVSGAVAPPSASLQAAERRRATLAVITAWRDVARDLAVVRLGGEREVRDRELLDELRAACDGVDPGALREFLDRLDALSAAVEAYASPGLVLDVLLLEWPGRRTPSRRAAA
jgi:DNA polymerase-3 subunit delta'